MSDAFMAAALSVDQGAPGGHSIDWEFRDLSFDMSFGPGLEVNVNMGLPDPSPAVAIRSSPTPSPTPSPTTPAALHGGPLPPGNHPRRRSSRPWQSTTRTNQRESRTSSGWGNHLSVPRNPLQCSRSSSSSTAASNDESPTSSSSSQGTHDCGADDHISIANSVGSTARTMPLAPDSPVLCNAIKSVPASAHTSFDTRGHTADSAGSSVTSVEDSPPRSSEYRTDKRKVEARHGHNKRHRPGVQTPLSMDHPTICASSSSPSSTRPTICASSSSSGASVAGVTMSLAMVSAKIQDGELTAGPRDSKTWIVNPVECIDDSREPIQSIQWSPIHFPPEKLYQGGRAPDPRYYTCFVKTCSRDERSKKVEHSPHVYFFVGPHRERPHFIVRFHIFTYKRVTREIGITVINGEIQGMRRVQRKGQDPWKPEFGQWARFPRAAPSSAPLPVAGAHSPPHSDDSKRTDDDGDDDNNHYHPSGDDNMIGPLEIPFSSVGSHTYGTAFRSYGRLSPPLLHGACCERAQLDLSGSADGDVDANKCPPGGVQHEMSADSVPTSPTPSDHSTAAHVSTDSALTPSTPSTARAAQSSPGPRRESSFGLMALAFLLVHVLVPLLFATLVQAQATPDLPGAPYPNYMAFPGAPFPLPYEGVPSSPALVKAAVSKHAGHLVKVALASFTLCPMLGPFGTIQCLVAGLAPSLQEVVKDSLRPATGGGEPAAPPSAAVRAMTATNTPVSLATTSAASSGLGAGSPNDSDLPAERVRTAARKRTGGTLDSKPERSRRKTGGHHTSAVTGQQRAASKKFPKGPSNKTAEYVGRLGRIELAQGELKGSLFFGKREDYHYAVPRECMHVSFSSKDDSGNTLNIGNGNGKATLHWRRGQEEARVHAWVNGAVGSANKVSWTVFCWLQVTA